MTGHGGDTLYTSDAYFYDIDPREELKADIPFFIDYASKMKGKVLELACGTGRITIPLAEAGNEIWALEFSEQMLEQFKNKLKKLSKDTVNKIHIIHGDMSDFKIDQKFPLIIIPARSFQLLLDEKKEISCLKKVYSHLTKNGHFIIEIGNFIKNTEEENGWVNEKETFSWENIDPKSGYKVRRTYIKKKINKKKQIIYPLKIYRITKDNGTVEKISKQSSFKYFFKSQIKSLLISNGFQVIEEMGSYDGKPIDDSPIFLFVCKKK